MNRLGKLIAGLMITLTASVILMGLLGLALFMETTGSQPVVTDVSTYEAPVVQVVTQEEAQINAIERVSEAIVGVSNIAGGRLLGEGSGIIYRIANGNTYIVTNEHVIARGDSFEVVFNNEASKRATAELVGSDVFTDLAVLRVRDYEAAIVAEFGNTEDLQIGQTVIAIGNPLGLEFAGSATSGIVSGHDRSVRIPITVGNRLQEWEMTVLQTDAAINPGNSGGALINLNGEVVGINSMKISSGIVEGMSFSIPTYVALPIIADLEMYGEVVRPVLGVNITNMSMVSDMMRANINIPQDIRTGVFIEGVAQDSLAEHMGIMPGDVVIALGGVEVIDILTFRKELFNYREGDELTITVIRNGEQLELTAEIFITPQNAA